MKSHTPNREEKIWMDQITQIGCIVCLKLWDLQTPAEVHHIQGKTRPGSHLMPLPRELYELTKRKGEEQFG